MTCQLKKHFIMAFDQKYLEQISPGMLKLSSEIFLNAHQSKHDRNSQNTVNIFRLLELYNITKPFAYWVAFHVFVVVCWHIFQSELFKRFYQEHYHRGKRFGFRSGLAFCRNSLQKSLLARQELRVPYDFTWETSIDEICCKKFCHSKSAIYCKT